MIRINMIPMMNHHNTTETMINITVVDVVIMIVGFILLLWGGVKVMDWLNDKTYNMKDPWDFIVIVIIGGLFSYIIVGVMVIGLFTYLI